MEGCDARTESGEAGRADRWDWGRGIGAGIALLLPARFQAYALGILTLGLIMHGWGMFNLHRLETMREQPQPVWGPALYWACWLALAAVSIAAAITAFAS